MAQESTFSNPKAFSAQHMRALEALYAESRAGQWGLSREGFAEGLRRSAEKRFRGGNAAVAEVEVYLKTLHLEDLALACACGEGIEVAWEFFVVHFRQELRDASRAILRSSRAGNDSRAEEMADSLYAELYGVRSARDGRRKSLFEYFHGRSKLSTWLRAVLAQRHVDLVRSDRGAVSLDTANDATNSKPAFEIPAVASTAPADPDRTKYLSRVDRALSTALENLSARERMLLAFYYVDQLTLAEIGKTFGEHDSTISRQLERTRRALRETVTAVLQSGAPAQDGRASDPGLNESQVGMAFEYAIEDWAFDLSRALSNAQATADPREKESAP